LLLEAVHILPR